MAGLAKIDLQDVYDASCELAEVVKLIADGKADGPQDSDAWDLRTKGGLQVVRLRSMLSPDELDLTSVNDETLEVLRNIWRIVSFLGYGEHLDGRDDCNSDEYRGPLSLPNEVGLDGRLRNFDEAVDTWPGGVPDFVSDEIRSKFMETKQESWSDFPSMLMEEVDRLSPEIANGRRAPAIPQEHLSRIMSKKEAAKLHNKGGVANPTDYFKGLIEKGMLTPPIGSGRRWRFDKRNFPQDALTQEAIS